MGLAREVYRIINAKSNLRNALIDQGIYVDENTKLIEYSKMINNIMVSAAKYTIELYDNNNLIEMITLANESLSRRLYYSCDRFENVTIKMSDSITNMANSFSVSNSILDNTTIRVYYKGKAFCGNGVTNMYNTFYNCQNITGSPVCGPNVVNMYQTYYNCPNLSGNAYFYSPNVSNVSRCFYGREVNNMLNLYVPANSTTLNTCLYTGTNSLVGSEITWAQSESNYYNATYNIYIYPTL